MHSSARGRSSESYPLGQTLATIRRPAALRLGEVGAICGVIGLDGRTWSAADLEATASELTGLGPHGTGGWAGTAGRCGVAVAAVMRRATPEDVSDRQPTVSRDGSLVLVGDLRVDNRDELGALLGLRDEMSVPDSAFVLTAYERWGEGFLARIVGDFALAIVDRRRGGVLLARDHNGTRPLVVHQRRGVVAFSSTALSLTALEGVGHALDVQHAREALGLLYTSERTFVEGVRWVPAASALWIDAERVRRWRWWQPKPTDVVDLGSPAAHEDELRDAFDRAVTARIRSAGGVGAGTSGGLDSTSAAATAALLLAPESLPTYTSTPPPGWGAGDRRGWDADESSLVLRLAELHPNIHPSFVQIVSGASLFGFHEPLWELGSGPVRNPCNWLWIYAIRARAGTDGVTTLLSGSRGNVQFSADGPHWLAALVRAGRFGTAWGEAAAWAKASGDGTFRTVRNGLVYPLLPGGLQRLARAAARRPEAIDEWVEGSSLTAEQTAALDLPAHLPLLDGWRRPEHRSTWLWTTPVYADQAETQSAVTALTGVEERDATADRRVVEVAMSQPEWVRRHDGVGRAVARGAMGDRLPPEILRRTRRGEQLPDWLDLMTAARPELMSELDQLEQHPTSRQLIDTARLRRLMNDWPDRASRADPRVVREYRLALLRGLFISKYLRWFEARAGRASINQACHPCRETPSSPADPDRSRLRWTGSS